MSFYEALAEVFDEFGYDGTFEQWLSIIGYTSSWTDEQLYTEFAKAFPDFVGYFSDWNLNPSWNHGGM